MNAKLAILCSLLALVMPAAANNINVWINEFHYKNAGSDANEFIEIAGTAGTSLTEYSLVLYNGNGGAAYVTMNLSGTIPDQQNGFGTVSFSPSSFQNGSPDGLALALNGSLIQFLSYEGTFTAVGSVADGMASTDIGVAESDSSTPADYSLQLTGSGSSYSDFTWAAPMTATPGAVNNRQTFSVPVSLPRGFGALTLAGVLLFSRRFASVARTAAATPRRRE